VDQKTWTQYIGLLEKCQQAGVSRASVVAALTGLLRVKKASVSVGKARGGGQSSKAKGRAAVQLVRETMLRWLPISPDDLFVKATSQGGTDLHIGANAQEVFPFAPEVKCEERLSIWAALEQADINAAHRRPIVFFKRARSPLYVALQATDLLRLLNERAGRHQESEEKLP
jgi:hypothetical protein